MKTAFLGILLLTSALSAQGLPDNSRIRSSCYIDPSGKVQGKNPDTLTEIASVSKLMVSHWVVSVLGPQSRLETRIHVTSLGTDSADVHIEGGIDPSFNINRLAILAGNLNTLGIKRIRNMTFDQNFRYKSAVYSGNQVAGDPDAWILTRDRLTPAVRESITGMTASYARARESGDVSVSREGLPESVTLRVDNIDYLASSAFRKTAETKTYISQSVPVHEIIKAMNLKSNNYIANILFDRLGGKDAYTAFIRESQGFTSAQIRFANGSGNPIVSGSGRWDNKATCRSVVTIVKDLRDKMVSHNMRFADVVAVAGSEHSTLSSAYTTDLTEGALIAKTGTINPAVALAGIASTAQGNIYFAVVVADGRRGGAGSSGRVIIRQQVESIFREYGGSDEIDYTASSFFEVDDSAKLQQQDGSALQ